VGIETQGKVMAREKKSSQRREIVKCPIVATTKKEYLNV